MHSLIVTLSLIAIPLRASIIVLGDLLSPSNSVIIIALIGTVLGGLFTILGSILKKLIDQGKILPRIMLVLVGYTLFFTLMLFGIYLITNNAFILSLGAIIGVLLPFTYGYYFSHKREELDDYDSEHRTET